MSATQALEQAPAATSDAAQTAAISAAYDSEPYPCEALPQTHPDVMAVAALLHGMTPAAIDGCRVLELGCGDGSNLLPLAQMFQKSRFVGIDLSPRQLAQGQSIIEELSLANIELYSADLMTLGDELGVFDYIICHGVYSWVPEGVKDGILKLCGRHLAPQGVAYISYNVYPGGHKHQALREMMMYHTSSIAEPIEAARQGLALVDFLLRNQADPNSTYALLLREEFERLRRMPLGYLSHDHLEQHNTPCYFHEFMARAAAHGLQFLAEADKTGSELLPPAVQEALAELTDPIRREQYIDFARNSSFRSTLLCRGDVKLVQDGAEKIGALRIRSTAHPNDPIHDVRSPDAVQFTTRFGEAAVAHPVFKAMAVALHAARPATLALIELAARISDLLGTTMSAEQLADMVVYAQRTGFLALCTQDRPIASPGDERPLATPLARLQARRQLGVTNLWHQRVNLDALDRHMLQLLDGTRDAQALIAELVTAFAEGLRPSGSDASLDVETLRNRAPQLLLQLLEGLHGSGLLAAPRGVGGGAEVRA